MTLADSVHAGGRVAVLGLGAMGLEMATRLADDFSVVGYDPSPDCADRAAERDIVTKLTAASAADGAAALLLAVRTIDHAQDALFGMDGAIEGLAAGTVVILTSTVGAPGAVALATRLAENNIRMLDLPVSGGPRRAGAGDLLVFAGGPPADFDAVSDVVAALSSRVARAGDRPGDGQAMKTVNQLLCGVHIAAAVEALTLARSLGLDLTTVLDVLGAGAAASFMLADRGPRIVQSLDGETPEIRSRLDIFVKDMGIVLDAGRLAGVALPVAAATEQLFRIAANAGFSSSDDSTTASILA